MNMVFSRPMWSDTNPKNGRPKPSKMRSSEIAKVSAAIWKPSMLTGSLAILKSCAIGAIWAAAIRPPAATITNTRYITQKIGLRSTCGGVKSILVCGRLSFFFFAGIGLRRLAQEKGEHEYDHALPDAEGEKGLLVAAGGDHVGDRHHGERGSRAEAGGGRARGEAAVIRKPFQRIADAGAVHRAGADAAEDGADVKQRQRIGVGVQHPGKRDHYRAELDDDARAISVDEPASTGTSQVSVTTNRVKASWIAARPQ